MILRMVDVRLTRRFLISIANITNKFMKYSCYHPLELIFSYYISDKWITDALRHTSDIQVTIDKIRWKAR